MKRTTLLSIMLVISATVFGQIKDPKATEVWEPVPRKITPGEENSAPPSDAIVLFDYLDECKLFECFWNKLDECIRLQMSESNETGSSKAAC